MSIWQKVGLVKEDPPLTMPKQQVSESQQTVTAPIYQTFGAGNQTVSPPPVSSKTDYNQHLDELLRKNNLPGFDFLEFIDILAKLDTKPLTEQAKYETAFMSAQAMGVTVMDLVAAGNKYLQVLSQEQSEFEGEMKAATATKVEAKKTEINRLTTENAQYQAKIEANNKTIQDLNIGLLDSSNVLGTEAKAFEYALTNKTNLLKDRISKIQQYNNDTK